MEYKILNNGIKMPLVGLGTNNLKGETCRKAVINAFSVGYRLIDTANMYNNEKDIAEAIKIANIDRKELFIVSKISVPNIKYERIRKAIDQTLNNLNTDYIDLLLINEPYMSSKEMYKAFIEAYKDGKVKSIGISNFNKKLYKRFIKNEKIIPQVNEVESHIFFNQLELKKVLEKNKTVMVASSPLTSKIMDIDKCNELINIGKKYNKTPYQVSLKFLVQNGIIVIPKSTNIDNMKQNINIFDFNLTKDDIKKIESLNLNKSLFNWY